MIENMFLLSQKCLIFNNNAINKNCSDKLLENEHFLNEKQLSKPSKLWRKPIPGRHIYAANSNHTIQFGTTEYFLYCAMGGVVSCGKINIL